MITMMIFIPQKLVVNIMTEMNTPIYPSAAIMDF